MVMANRWSGAVLRPTVAAGLRLLLQQLLQKLGCVGDAHRTFVQHNTRAHALEQLAAGGTVALLKLLHDLPHALHGLGPVSYDQSIDDACAHDRSAGAFSVAHARRETVARVLDGFFVQSCQVAVGAEYGLCAVVRAAAFLLRCQFLSTFHCSCSS